MRVSRLKNKNAMFLKDLMERYMEFDFFEFALRKDYIVAAMIGEKLYQFTTSSISFAQLSCLCLINFGFPLSPRMTASFKLFWRIHQLIKLVEKYLFLGKMTTE